MVAEAPPPPPSPVMLGREEMGMGLGRVGGHSCTLEMCRLESNRSTSDG